MGTDLTLWDWAFVSAAVLQVLQPVLIVALVYAFYRFILSWCAASAARDRAEEEAFSRDVYRSLR